MPVTHVRRQRAQAPAESSWENDLSGDSSAEAQPLALRRPKRGAADPDSAAEGSDEQPRAPQPHEWPQQRFFRRARQRPAVAPETPEEASRRALDELRRVLRKRGHKDTEVPQLLQGWTATREQKGLNHRGHRGGYKYTFTDPDGETYGNIVSAACAAEPRAAGEEELLFAEVHWEGERYRRLAALPQYRRPFGLRHCELPPPPVDPVPPASGGFVYGTGAPAHAPWLVDSLKAAGGDIGDPRCERPRALLATACAKANVRPPAYQRDLAPATWMEDVLALAKQETNPVRQGALRELARAAEKIDEDCREAARKAAEEEWDEPKCCHVAAALAVFSLEHGTEREAEVQDCVARYGEDGEIELEWLGPNRPFDLDHLAWTELPRAPASKFFNNKFIAKIVDPRDDEEFRDWMVRDYKSARTTVGGVGPA